MNPTLRRLGMLMPLAALLLVPTATQAGSGTTRWVDDDGKAGPAGCDTQTAAPTTVQSGVDGAAPGDTVRVCPGIYVGTVVIPASKDGLTLTATARAAATLRMPDTFADEDDLLTIDGADRVAIRWLRFQARKTPGCDAIGDMVNVIGGKDVSVRGIVTRGLAKARSGCDEYLNGVTFREGASGLVAYSSFVDFAATGVRIRSTAGPVTVLRNSIRIPQTGAASPSGGGVGVSAFAAGARIVGNAISGSATFAGDGYLEYGVRVGTRIEDDEAGDWLTRRRLVIEGNTVTNALYGVWVESDLPYATGAGVKIIDNTAAKPLGGRGLYVEKVTRPLVRGNTLTGYDTGIWVSFDVAGGTISGNTAQDSSTLDCYDESTGSGTAGTANTWTGNTGLLDNDSDLCAPPAP